MKDKSIVTPAYISILAHMCVHHISKYHYHGQNRAQCYCYIILWHIVTCYMWLFGFSRFIYKISLKSGIHRTKQLGWPHFYRNLGVYQKVCDLAGVAFAISRYIPSPRRCAGHPTHSHCFRAAAPGQALEKGELY